MKSIKIYSFIYFFVLIFYLEIVYKISVFNSFFDIGLLYMFLFTLSLSFLLGVLTSLFSKKVNRILIWIITGFITFMFLGNFIFKIIYLTHFSFNQLSLVGQITGFIDVIIENIFGNILVVLLMLIPVILFIIFRKKIEFMIMDKRRIFIFLALFVVIHVIAVLALIPGRGNNYSSYQLYYRIDTPNHIIERFGLITGMRIDLKRIIFKFEEGLLEVPKLPGKPNDKNKEEIKYNVMDIDFAELIANETDGTLREMHSYFLNQEPTRQNEYTGMFEGKNLIFIVAEAFSGFVIDKELTPTLYKMANSSFVFENFYTPIILSTIGGEMQALMGLLPTLETINSWPVIRPEFPFAIGNAFGNIGYQANAYHNWSYTFYRRHITRPTLGFHNYMGCRNGLEKLMECRNWLPSDIEMIEVIAPKIIGQEKKQVTYFLTVSGHTPWSWGASNIARKHRSLVQHLPYSDIVKGYIASQIELDRALELLIAKLDEAGELDDTVIAIVGDHYPYNLNLEQMNELSGRSLDEVIEVNRSSFILWNNKAEKVKVDKVASQIDVLPTLLNLFGIEYDSRLIIGNDILSEAPGLSIFANREWVTDYGRYVGRNFTPNRGVKIPENYVDIMNTIVANKFSMSRLLMQRNYYKVVLGR